MTSDDLVLVGRVARAHGNRGQVIVNPDTDFPNERFRVGARLVVGRDGSVGVPRRIRAVRFQQGRPIIAFEGIDTMDDAEALTGSELLVPEAALPPLPEGTFHRHVLVGCEVRDRSGVVIGRVTAVEGPMERSHLVVEGARGEILIPMTGGMCVSVDPAGQRIVVDPPEGLVEVNERSR